MNTPNKWWSPFFVIPVLSFIAFGTLYCVSYPFERHAVLPDLAFALSVPFLISKTYETSFISHALLWATCTTLGFFTGHLLIAQASAVLATSVFIALQARGTFTVRIPQCRNKLGSIPH